MKMSTPASTTRIRDTVSGAARSSALTLGLADPTDDRIGPGTVPPVARFGGTRTKIVALSTLLWAVSASLVIILYRPQQWGDPTQWAGWFALPALAIGFALTEIFVVHLRIRADAHTFSLVELPLALGLFFAAPLVLIGAQLVGAGLALVLHRKQGPLKLLFNTGVFASTTTTAMMPRLAVKTAVMMPKPTLERSSARRHEPVEIEITTNTSITASNASTRMARAPSSKIT